MTGLAIRADGLGKQFRKGANTRGSLFEWLRGRQTYEYFWALKDVSFEVHRGEMLGIIGPNGAGKSTLLRILSRITRPTEGSAVIHGRVGSLLDVGTGFHPELTGRENVYLNGILIGMRKAEIRTRFDEIVDFSGVTEFIDTPLKRYSSGMQVRLGFAVAVHLSQEIMLVDEVLAVGDAAFREKCLEKMDRATRTGRTVLFVGHNMEMISSSCKRTIWLDNGRIVADGSAAEIVHAYQHKSYSTDANGTGFLSLDGLEATEVDGSLRLTHVRFLDGRDREVPSFESGQNVRFAIGYRLLDVAKLPNLSVGLTIRGSGQTPITSCENSCVGTAFDDLGPVGEFVCEIAKLPLVPGRYRLGLRCKIGSRTVYSLPNAGTFSVVGGDFHQSGVLPSTGCGPMLFDYRWFLDPAKKR